MNESRGPLSRTARLFASFWMVGAAFAATAAAVVSYLVLAMPLSAVLDRVPRTLGAGIDVFYVLVPLLIALVVIGTTSVALLAEDQGVPGVAAHLWHCAAFYVLLVADAFLMRGCGAARPAVHVATRCADPFGVSIAAALICVGAILADGWAVLRRRRQLAPRGLESVSR